MAYLGLNIDDTVHNCQKYSHAIPAYPQVTSSTVFDDDFYSERRLECRRLIGGEVDYHTLSTDCAVGIEDIDVSGPTEIAIGEVFFYSLLGSNSESYVEDYEIKWSVPPGQGSIWGYESDTVDVITVQIGGYQIGSGVITCTLTNRTDPSDITVVTQPITITPYS
jgi:hypothetical protein